MAFTAPSLPWTSLNVLDTGNLGQCLSMNKADSTCCGTTPNTTRISSGWIRKSSFRCPVGFIMTRIRSAVRRECNKYIVRGQWRLTTENEEWQKNSVNPSWSRPNYQMAHILGEKLNVTQRCTKVTSMCKQKLKGNGWLAFQCVVNVLVLPGYTVCTSKVVNSCEAGKASYMTSYLDLFNGHIPEAISGLSCY